MERTRRIVDRLPGFYRAWDPESVMYKVLFAVGVGLSEPHGDLSIIMKSHWVDTAFTTDLDLLGSIFDLSRNRNEADEAYRVRIKNAVQGFKGGGTKESIVALMGVFLGLRPDERIEVRENPPRPLQIEKQVVSGDSWTLGSMSTEDATPAIEVGVGGKGLSIVDPVLTNADTGERLRFEGELKSGQRLSVSGGSAELDGTDVSDRLPFKTVPRLPRGGSRWSFEEVLAAKVGRFDRSTFDGSVFAVPVPATTVRFSWVGREPASFIVDVPSSALERNGLSKGDAEELLNIIKAAGIKATVGVSS